MQTIQIHKTETKSLTHCIARLINQHPEYMKSAFDEYLLEEVKREWIERPKTESVLRIARTVRQRIKKRLGHE